LATLAVLGVLGGLYCTITWKLHFFLIVTGKKYIHTPSHLSATWSLEIEVKLGALASLIS
jgi:hypothetical protein